MAAEDERGHIFNADLQFVGDKGAKARRVENAGHPDHPFAGKAAHLVCGLGHCVERIGNDDQNAIWRILDSLADHVLHNFVVCVEQVVAAHARLAWNSSSDDDDVRIGGISVVVSADDVGVALFNWHGFEQVEAFTLRDSFDDVNEDNVREFFRGDPVGGGRADVSRTYDSHFLTHVCSFAQDQKLLTAEAAEIAQRSQAKSRRVLCMRSSGLQWLPRFPNLRWSLSCAFKTLSWPQIFTDSRG